MSAVLAEIVQEAYRYAVYADHQPPPEIVGGDVVWPNPVDDAGDVETDESDDADHEEISAPSTNGAGADVHSSIAALVEVADARGPSTI